jgi:hypothetical protein
MINQDTWDFAQKYCARMSIYMFFPSLILAIVIMPMPRVINMSMSRIGLIGLGITIIQMISFVAIIISTEKSLKNTFDESGNRV